MYLGLSKNLGGGFRVGVGTKLGGSKKPSKNNDFQKFIESAQTEFNNAFCDFIAANGLDINELK